MDPEFADLLKEDLEPAGVAEGGSTLDYRTRFRAIRRNEILATLLFTGGIVALFALFAVAIGSDMLAPSTLGPYVILGTVAFALAGSSAMILNWHCPRCRKYLGRATAVHLLFFPEFSIKRCPYCAVRLQ